jgi:hypothetical protein
VPSSILVHRKSILTGMLLVALATPAASAPSPAERCAKAKLAAAGKAVQATLRCHGSSFVSGDPVKANCLTKARDAMVRTFARLESEGGCARTGDAEAILDHVELFVALALNRLEPPGPTPTPGPSPTPTVAPDCADPQHWACCGGVDVPGIGSCSEALVGPSGSDAANNFHSGCTLAGGFSLQGRCPTPVCGTAAYCCHVGECGPGTSGWYGDVSEEAIQYVCESATSIEPGACP